MRIVLFYNGDRGHWVSNAIYAAGFEAKHVQDRDVNDPEFVEYMKESEVDLFIVAGYSRIFKADILSVPRLGTWNCHAGPVPEYRGGSPLNWQIINGRKMLEVSLIEMDEGIDTGPVIDKMRFKLDRDETIVDAHCKANERFGWMIQKALKYGVDPKPQPESDAYKPQRNDDMGEIDFKWSVERIHNFVRALTHPYPGAWFQLDGRRIRIWSASLD